MAWPSFHALVFKTIYHIDTGKCNILSDRVIRPEGEGLKEYWWCHKNEPVIGETQEWGHVSFTLHRKSLCVYEYIYQRKYSLWLLSKKFFLSASFFFHPLKMVSTCSLRGENWISIRAPAGRGWGSDEDAMQLELLHFPFIPFSASIFLPGYLPLPMRRRTIESNQSIPRYKWKAIVWAIGGHVLTNLSWHTSSSEKNHFVVDIWDDVETDWIPTPNTFR